MMRVSIVLLSLLGLAGAAEAHRGMWKQTLGDIARQRKLSTTTSMRRETAELAHLVGVANSNRPLEASVAKAKLEKMGYDVTAAKSAAERYGRTAIVPNPAPSKPKPIGEEAVQKAGFLNLSRYNQYKYITGKR